MNGERARLREHACALLLLSDPQMSGSAPGRDLCSVPSQTGISRFHAQRRQWTNAGTSSTRDRRKKRALNRVPLTAIDHDALLDSIVNRTEFEEYVPLPVLVDVLNDLWEADGLFE